jgi:DNA-directed RNA polymerase subunit RPC12/RpoP
MKWPFSFNVVFRRKPTPSPLTRCPRCGRDMDLIERTTMTGSDMRTYRCGRCRREQIVDFGTAQWQAMSDAREKEGGS